MRSGGGAINRISIRFTSGKVALVPVLDLSDGNIENGVYQKRRMRIFVISANRGIESSAAREFPPILFKSSVFFQGRARTRQLTTTG